MNSKQRNYGLYAVAAAIFAIGALSLGLPASTLFFLAIVLVCPLMMLFMMRGMHGGGMHGGGMHGGMEGGGMHDRHDDTTQQQPAPDRAPLTKHNRPPSGTDRT
jgi:hypothetical protein